jgi:pyruvate,water dikinase
MEMVDSAVAGVAFSTNPLNSDRDECGIDSLWGLGESVVDGSVTADRFIYDKVEIERKIVHQAIGSKPPKKTS